MSSPNNVDYSLLQLCSTHTEYSSFSLSINLCLFRPHRQERLEVVEVVEPVSDQDVSILSRIVGEETQGKVVDSIISWARDKAKENPGCVERFVCEMYKTGETMNGIPYLLMSITK